LIAAARDDEHRLAIGLLRGEDPQLGEKATLATNGAGQSAGSVAGTNVPFGGAGQSAIRSAAFHARELVSGVGGGVS